MTYEELSEEEKRLIDEHVRREHEERMRDPEFRRGWERAESLHRRARERDEAVARARELETALNWGTSCLSCARALTASLEADALVAQGRRVARYWRDVATAGAPAERDPADLAVAYAATTVLDALGSEEGGARVMGALGITLEDPEAAADGGEAVPEPEVVALRRRVREAEGKLARVAGWVSGDEATARSSFGDGYREAQRDVGGLIGVQREGGS